LADSDRAPRAEFLVVGLGNPENGYAGTRHNIGFLVADLVAKRCGATPWRRNVFSDVASGSLAGRGILLAKPLTFMNRSGTAVADLLARHNLPPSSLIVVHDDLDLPYGRIRLRPGGGHGGHNGIRSVIAETGTPDFCRVRLGIGRPAEGVAPADHVLSPFSPAERETLDSFVTLGADAVELIIREGIGPAMNRVPGGIPLPSSTPE
jgi:PTH1 family peptidyl-tRNA hydrolase